MKKLFSHLMIILLCASFFFDVTGRLKIANFITDTAKDLTDLITEDNRENRQESYIRSSIEIKYH